MTQVSLKEIVLFLKDLFLGPLLFLCYINDPNQATKFCKVHHFADDTNLLYLGKPIKKLQNLGNIDLKSLVNWLNENKISLNV